MLSLTTLQERPDLEEERNAIIVSCAEMEQNLGEIEDSILHRLTVSEGSIIDDIDLIHILEISKTKSEEIKVENYIKYYRIIIELLRSRNKIVYFYFYI